MAIFQSNPARIVQSNYQFVGSGGISLISAPKRNYNASLDFGILFTHIAYGSGDPDFNVSLNFEYTVSSGKLYWYRVMLYCQQQSDSEDFCPAIDDIFQNLEESINLNPIDQSQTHCSKIRMRTSPIKLGGVADISFSQLNQTTYDNGLLESDYITRDGACGSLQGDMVSIKCAKKKPILLMAVIARDLDELCKKLKSPTLGPKVVNWRICNVVKFTTPVNESSGLGVKAELEQQDISNIESCIDYNLDYNFTNFTKNNLCNNRFVFYSFAKRVYYKEFVLNLSLTGESNVQFLQTEFEGFITVYPGPSEIEQSTFTYPEPEDSNLSIMNFEQDRYFYDSLYLHGNSNFLIDPLIRSFSGSLEVGGSLLRFIFPIRNYNFYLNLNLSSISDIKYKLEVNSYNLIEIGGVLEFELRKKFIYQFDISLRLSGSSKILSNYRFYNSAGSLFLGVDRVEIISGFRYYLSEGFISIQGSPNRLGRCVASSDGGFEILGSSKNYVIYKFDFNGGLNILGTTPGIVFENRIINLNDNNIYIDGEADLNFINLGLMVSKAVFYSFYSNISFEFLENNQPTLIPQQEVVSNCGCVSSQSISLEHNIINSNIISSFISRNNIDYKSKVQLSYKSSSKNWFNTQSLSGFSSRGENASLKFIFDLSCTNFIENEEYAQQYFKFNFFAKYQNSVTNLIIYIEPEKICSNGVLSAIITRQYSTETGYSLFVDSNPISESFFRITDNIGIFSDDYWNKQFNYSRLRPQYYQTEIFENPKISGVWPEFLINFGNLNVDNLNLRKVIIENPAAVNL